MCINYKKQAFMSKIENIEYIMYIENNGIKRVKKCFIYRVHIL